jgi:hypothetical protein
VREVQKAVGIETAKTHPEEAGPREGPLAQSFFFAALQQFRRLT